jgi:hypothetical protein
LARKAESGAVDAAELVTCVASCRLMDGTPTDRTSVVVEREIRARVCSMRWRGVGVG